MDKIFERSGKSVAPGDFFHNPLGGQAEGSPRKPAAGRRDNSRKPRRPDEAAP
jgi:hypothetical protein